MSEIRGCSGLLSAVFVLSICTAGTALRGADGAASRPAGWDEIVQLYGQEDTGEWSLRAPDKLVTEGAHFRFMELWTYDLASKQWKQLDSPPATYTIVLPSAKSDQQPPEEQVLYDLTAIKPGMVGVFYAKWRVNAAAGATFFRIGPGRVGPAANLGHVPKGMIATLVPLDSKVARDMLVPDPKIFCVDNPPTTAPAK